jgi:hypothetical protein
MAQFESHRDVPGPDGSSSQAPIGGEEEALAWEQIEAGRYMPRRIRGSCRGRVLG